MYSVSVPASSANLGAGFDCIGLAVNRRLEARVTLDAAVDTSLDTSLDASSDASSITPSDTVKITRSGTLSGFTAPAQTDLVFRGFAAALARANRQLSSRVHFTLHSTIPVARGLGSSAAAIVAGAVLANRAFDLGFDAYTLVDICAAIEGHPDNVAPSILGGATLGVANGSTNPDRNHAYTIAPLAVHPSLAFVFAIPPFPTETKKARGVLPETVPYSTAVLAASRAAALVQGLATADPALLVTALDDVLHVPYRRALIQGYDAVTEAAQRAGAIGATLSGSGSTLVAIATQGTAEHVRAAMHRAWGELGVASETFISSTHPVAGAV